MPDIMPDDPALSDIRHALSDMPDNPDFSYRIPGIRPDDTALQSGSTLICTYIEGLEEALSDFRGM